MNASISNHLDFGNSATCQAEPESLVIHSAKHIQVSPWNEWAQQTAFPILEKAGWVPRMLGRELHMVHRMFAGETP